MANIDFSWPKQLESTFKWASALNLEIVRLPSLACMLADTQFLTRLLGYDLIKHLSLAQRYNAHRYALGPMVVILILLLPWLWSRIRCSRDVARVTFTHFMTLKLFGVFFVYAPVSRIMLSALKCDDIGLDGSFLHEDYRVDCDGSLPSDMWIRAAGIAFTVFWPLGAPLYFYGLMRLYKVPEMAKRKIERAEHKAFLRFCIANARQHSTALDPSVTEDCELESLSEDCLRKLVCAANSVGIDYKPALKLTDKFFMDLLMRFARKKEVVPVPIEQRRDRSRCSGWGCCRCVHAYAAKQGGRAAR